ncbi:YaaL family protein, partial [Bacillus solimangrovi]
MLFLKKKKSARERNVERLLLLLEKAKTEWINIRDLYEKSVDPSDELRYELQLAKSILEPFH